MKDDRWEAFVRRSEAIIIGVGRILLLAMTVAAMVYQAYAHLM